MPGPGRQLVARELIGRDAEIAALTSAVVRAPAVVSLEGEAGVGKTRLVSELLARPEVAGRTVLVGRCHAVRESFPLGPVIEAMAGLGERLRGLSLSAVAGALAPLMPELAAVLPPVPEPLGDRVAERHRVFRGLVAVLRALPPVVLVVEDLHWADEQTVDFIAYLCAEPVPGSVLVLTYRGEEAGAGVRALTVKLPAGTTGVHVAVPLLDSPATGALAAAILETDRVSEEFGEYLWERTSGLPFAVEEVLALVRERGLLARRGGKWARKALDQLEVPRAIRDSTVERVAGLPAAARRLIEAAAVLATPVALPVLLDTAQHDCDIDGIGAVEEAIDAGLLAETGDAVGFRHALAAQAVYDGLSGPRRRELHGRAAAALRACPPVPLGRVAHHLRSAARLAEWAVTAEAAADEAASLADDAEAVRLLGDVLRHAPLSGEQRGRLAVKVGRAAIQSLPELDVADLLSEVLALDPPRPVRGELRFLLAMQHNQSGADLHAERRLFTEAVADLEERPDLRARAMVALGIPITPGVPMAEHLRWINRGLELIDGIDDPQDEVLVSGKAGMVLISIGDPAWRGLANRVRRVTGGRPRQRREAYAHFSIGVEACYAGHLETAEELLTAGLRSPAARENRRLEVSLRTALALHAYFRGTWTGLRDEAGVLLDETGDYMRLRIDAEAVAGCLALAHGDVDAAVGRLSDLIELAGQMGGLQVVPVAVDAVVRAALSRGAVADAAAQVRRCVERLATKGLWAPVARLLPSAAEALTAAGAAQEARELAARAERELVGLDVPLLPAALAYARGVLDDRAEDFLAAARMYTARSAPYEAARANERAAARLLAAGDERGAATMRGAVASYERLGASWDHGRASGLARGHGVSLPARHRGGRKGYGTTLSPRERQVAELAATGRTNKEIAEALVVSVNTVEKHLGAVMRKLRARSRTQLAHLMVKDGAFP